MRHVDKTTAVEVNHGIDGLVRDALPIPELAKPRGIDEVAHIGIEVRQTLLDSRDICLAREVCHNGNRRRTERVGDLLQCVVVAGDEPQFVYLLEKVYLPGEFPS